MYLQFQNAVGTLFQNNPRNLDVSYKTDLDLWDCLGRVQLILYQYYYIGVIQLLVVIVKRGKPSLIDK